MKREPERSRQSGAADGVEPAFTSRILGDPGSAAYELCDLGKVLNLSETQGPHWHEREMQITMFLWGLQILSIKHHMLNKIIGIIDDILSFIVIYILIPRVVFKCVKAFIHAWFDSNKCTWKSLAQYFFWPNFFRSLKANLYCYCPVLVKFKTCLQGALYSTMSGPNFRHSLHRLINWRETGNIQIPL